MAYFRPFPGKGGFYNGYMGGFKYPTATEDNDTLAGTARADYIKAKGGDDTIIDAGGKWQRGCDLFSGDDGNDTIYAHWGRDKLMGGAGDDMLISRSDAGEPVIAQDPTLAKVYPGEPLRCSNDTLYGGDGADTFMFRLDLNAKLNILAKHVDATGNIDWAGVTGENGAAHDHWVESIGNDVIKDFVKGVDNIVIEGHTVEYKLSYQDVNGDGVDETIISLNSQQGAAGAHDEDLLGTITVYGDQVTDEDITLDAMAHHGAFANISDVLLA
jgi:Ca2+-binding RTX toxin-like protein